MRRRVQCVNPPLRQTLVTACGQFLRSVSASARRSPAKTQNAETVRGAADRGIFRAFPTPTTQPDSRARSH